MKESGCSLAIRGVQKNYGKKTALAVADLTFTAGVYGLLGPNGAGKTTLLNILATVLPPDGGHVYCNGREIGRMGGGVPRHARIPAAENGFLRSFHRI